MGAVHATTLKSIANEHSSDTSNYYNSSYDTNSWALQRHGNFNQHYYNNKTYVAGDINIDNLKEQLASEVRKFVSSVFGWKLMAFVGCWIIADSLSTIKKASEQRHARASRLPTPLPLPLPTILPLYSGPNDDISAIAAGPAPGTPVRWRRGIVPYVICVTDRRLRKMIEDAINEFNDKTPVRWSPRRSQPNYAVFMQSCTGPSSPIGCYLNGPQFIQLPYPNYPNSNYKLRRVCILHEMMHMIGFGHIHQRSDRAAHVRVKCGASGYTNNNRLYGGDYVDFGPYDYKSIMHYGHGAGGIECISDELRNCADKSDTFSQGDLAIIRRIYRTRKHHLGEWHNACTGWRCTDMFCACGACGKLEGGVNCGYVGTRGHWTCCMNETRHSDCHPTHTGFWHKKCTDKRCTNTICYCDSCGGGCNYQGSEAHWSCCCIERFKSQCPISLYYT